MNLPIEWIETTEQLQSLCHRLENSEFIALDTEFLREKTYYPKLCLIQIATTELVACIDPLHISDLAPLKPILDNHNILKVFHAASQDLEIFYQLNDRLPEPVFDTQIAAAMLGLGEQISYAALVTSVLNIELEKTQSRTDWTKRPLSQAQIEYAADDVRYLVKAYLKQDEILKKTGREQWLEADFQQLSDPQQFQMMPENLLKRIKGRQRLKPRQLAIAQNLAVWRENEAIAKNKPRKWILADDVIVDLARRPPSNSDSLPEFRGLHEGLIRRSGKEIIQAILSAQALTENDLPSPDRFKKLSRDEAIMVEAIMAIVNLLGKENDISPSVIGSKKQIESLVLGDQCSLILQGWRYELCGKQLSDFIAGKSQLSVVDGQLKLLDSGVAGE